MIDKAEKLIGQFIAMEAVASNERIEALSQATGMINSLTEAFDASQRDALEQARLNGVGAERELVLMARLEAAQRRIEKLEAMDREAATHVESVICMRTDFTGDPPYVGWKGLGLAMSEAFDERDALSAVLKTAREALDPCKCEQVCRKGMKLAYCTPYRARAAVAQIDAALEPVTPSPVA